MTYKLLSYQAGAQQRAGLLIGERIYDAERLTGESSYSGVLTSLNAWDAADESFNASARRVLAEPSRYSQDEVADARLLAPVLFPGAIYGAGANYFDHVQEMNRAHGFENGPTMKEQGEQPWHFLKASRSCVVGPGAVVPLPAHSQAIDWEIELVAVMGRLAKDVSVERALDYVAGYTVANDLSSRDTLARKKTPPPSPFSFDWVSAKSFDGACPIGPWITPARDIGNPQNLGMKLWVGDELMQDSTTQQMIFTVAEQIAALSSRVSLQPGDLVLTGTPAGVGMPRKRFLQAGESVRLWIERIGEFEHVLA